MTIKSSDAVLSGFLLTILLTSACIAQQEEPQSVDKADHSKNVANVGYRLDGPSDEGKIEGKIPKYVVAERNMAYVRTLSMPEIYFVFDFGQGLRLGLPEEAKVILKDHWNEGLTFFHDDMFYKASNAQTRIDKDITWLNYGQKTELKLREIDNEAPNGKRKISKNEAQELWAFVNRAAADLLELTGKLD